MNIQHKAYAWRQCADRRFRLLDGDEADDKIIAVLKGNEFYEQWNDAANCPPSYGNL